MNNTKARDALRFVLALLAAIFSVLPASAAMAETPHHDEVIDAAGIFTSDLETRVGQVSRPDPVSFVVWSTSDPSLTVDQFDDKVKTLLTSQTQHPEIVNSDRTNLRDGTVLIVIDPAIRRSGVYAGSNVPGWDQQIAQDAASAIRTNAAKAADGTGDQSSAWSQAALDGVNTVVADLDRLRASNSPAVTKTEKVIATALYAAMVVIVVLSFIWQIAFGDKAVIRKVTNPDDIVKRQAELDEIRHDPEFDRIDPYAQRKAMDAADELNWYVRHNQPKRVTTNRYERLEAAMTMDVNSLRDDLSLSSRSGNWQNIWDERLANLRCYHEQTRKSLRDSSFLLSRKQKHSAEVICKNFDRELDGANRFVADRSANPLRFAESLTGKAQDVREQLTSTFRSLGRDAKSKDSTVPRVNDSSNIMLAAYVAALSTSSYSSSDHDRSSSGSSFDSTSFSSIDSSSFSGGSSGF